jgi:hypothetical protein
LADIFEIYGPDYIAKYGARMLPSHRRAMREICACRTPALGGKVFFCKKCNKHRYSYHSCKSRHCPKCGNEQASRWLEQQFDRLLPVRHFLVTFTLPAELRGLARSNQKILYSILMVEGAEALQKLAWDPRWVGGRLGIVAVLQTWTRDLRYHPHVHMIVTGGGLSRDESHFRRSSPNFLVPTGALQKIFRAKVRDAIRRQLPATWVPAKTWSRRWVVDIRPVGSGQSAFRYLAPYIFRVALSNKRILSIHDGVIRFQYKDGKSKKYRQKTLPAEEFIARFLQHVLPERFRKVRYYGIFSPRRKKQLAIARWLLPPVPTTAEDSPDDMPPPPPVNQCPECKETMELVGRLQRQPHLLFFTTIRSP